MGIRSDISIWGTQTIFSDAKVIKQFVYTMGVRYLFLYLGIREPCKIGNHYYTHSNFNNVFVMVFRKQFYWNQVQKINRADCFYSIFTIHEILYFTTKIIPRTVRTLEKIHLYANDVISIQLFAYLIILFIG